MRMTVAEGERRTEEHGRAPAASRRWPAWCHPENWLRPYYLATALFKALLLYRRGWRNAHAIVHRPLVWPIPHLPSGLAGLRIMFLSDLHLDGPAATTERLLALLPEIDADLTLLGGDYRWYAFGSSERTARELGRLAPVLRRPYGLYGILGNHDDPAFLEPMQAMGIQTLANEAEPVEFNGEPLWLVGLEDSHLWLRDDLERAMADVPEGAPSLVLCHALEPVGEAARRGCSLFLAGHTHWGQIALPGGVPLITHATVGRRFARGFWEIGALRGYTTSGAGVCGLPLRFNTRSEVVTLTLERA